MTDAYVDEVHAAMEQVIGRAWADPAFKSELISNPAGAFAELGVHWPERYALEFYDDPAAKIGEWSSVGKGQASVLRIPIPAAPDGSLSDADLAAIGGAADNCCCCTGLCCCTGAVGQDTWH